MRHLAGRWKDCMVEMGDCLRLTTRAPRRSMVAIVRLSQCPKTRSIDGVLAAQPLDQN